MKSPAKAARVNKAIEVIQHMNSGMTTVDACKEVGLPRSSYYEIIKNNKETITEFQQMVQANAKQQLGLILANKTEILQMIIADGLSEETSPRDRIAIFKVLSELNDKLKRATDTENQAAEYLETTEFLKQGVKTSLQQSNYPASDTMITIKDKD
jgi:hypothetical protein